MEGSKMNKFEYIAQACADYQDVLDGRKPLMIVSTGKSYYAVEMLYRLALESEAVEYLYDDLVCEDGELHRHLFITQAGAPYAREAREAIVDCLSEAILTDDVTRKRELRAQLQLKLGQLLGHSAGECVEFINSKLGYECPCDCCGSEFTVTRHGKFIDGNPSRFVENGYVY
jgi:hypothetical protein